ncbi:Ig-like domain-containing protein [Candidatus Palauibacter sp.]|uniref:Ig-like domain-containing protein n=1 Tax=Candidatus Palauibacter sp. TaxID=3101350 RepID=UPI003AF2064F
MLAAGLVVSYCTDALGPDARHPPSTRVQRTAAPSLVISPDSVVLASLGEERQLEATLTDEEGGETTPAVAWFSADTLVASVDSAGLVTARANGATFVEATHSGYADSARVVVEQRADRLEIAADALFFLRLYEYREIRAGIFDAAGSPMDGEVTWSSSDNGVVRAPTRCGGTPGLEFPCARSEREGRAVLIATHDAVADTIPLTVAVARSIRVNSSSQLNYDRPGETSQIDADALDARGKVIDGAPIAYESLDSSVAIVDSVGLITVRSYGSTAISLKAGRSQAQVAVDVYSSARAVAVRPDTLWSYRTGDTLDAAVIVQTVAGPEYSPFDQHLSVAWAALDSTIVRIDSNQVMTSAAEGTTKLIATYFEYNQSGELASFVDTAAVVVTYVDRIAIQTRTIRLASAGDSILLTLAAWFNEQRVTGPIRPNWSSAHEEVATVDQYGRVTAVSRGFAEIRAEVGTLLSRIVVSVSQGDNSRYRRVRSGAVLEGSSVRYAIGPNTSEDRTNVSYRIAYPRGGIGEQVRGPASPSSSTAITGNITVPPGSTGSLSFTVLDDAIIDPPRDTILVHLTDGTDRFLDTVVVKEGVCDRSEPVMSQILFWAPGSYRKVGSVLEPDLDRCWELDDESLNGVRRMRLFAPTPSADGAVRLDTIPMMTLEELRGSGILQNLGSRADHEKLDLRRADFSGLTSLIDLWIINYDLTDVSWEDEVFAELPVLEQLIFQNNKMSDIPATMFRGINTGGGSSGPTCPERTLYRRRETGEPYCYMVSLLVAEVEFAGTLSADLLDPLEGVIALQFGRMDMETIPSGFFDDLPDLGNVTLVDLPLTAIDAGLFANNPGLFRLNMLGVLNENRVALPAGFLESNTDLRRVNLKANGLTAIDGAFADGTTIEELWLASNELSTLPAGFLGRVTPKLRQLDLSRNQFEEIPDGFFEGLEQPISRLLLHANPGPDRDTLTNDFSISASIAEREVETGRSMKLAVNIPAGSPVDVPFDVFVSSGYFGTAVESQDVVSTELVLRAGGTVTDSITITRLDTIPFVGSCVTFEEPLTDPCWTSPSTAPNSKAEVVVRSRGGAVDVSGLTLRAEFDPMALFTTDEPSMPFLRKPLPVIRVLKGGSYLPSALHPEGQAFNNPNRLGEVRIPLNGFFGRTATATESPDFDIVAFEVDPFEEHTTSGSVTNPVVALSPSAGIERRAIADTTYTVDWKRVASNGGHDDYDRTPMGGQVRPESIVRR